MYGSSRYLRLLRDWSEPENVSQGSASTILVGEYGGYRHIQCDIGRRHFEQATDETAVRSVDSNEGDNLRRPQATTFSVDVDDRIGLHMSGGRNFPPTSSKIRETLLTVDPGRKIGHLTRFAPCDS
jgi:hypothetical protein